MPYKTEYGSHYHLTYGCHGATIPCDTAGLTPCSDCCGGGEGGGDDAGSGSGLVGGSPASGDASASYEIGGTENVAAGVGQGAEEGEYEAPSGELMSRGVTGMVAGQPSPEEHGDLSADLSRLSGNETLAHADSGMYTSRAVPEIVLTEDEARTVAKVLAMYVDSGAYTIGRNQDGLGLASDRDFQRVLTGMMSDLVPVMPKAEHEELARRELAAKAAREVQANFHAVDHLEPCDPDYVPFSSYPVELRGGRLAHGIPDATGWQGVPFVDATRDGRHRYMGSDPVWDYLPGPFETHEDIPITLDFGNYHLEAVINCGISPVPGAKVTDDYDYDHEVTADAPARPRVERVRLVAATHNGQPVDVSGMAPQEDGDFNAFRHGVEDWLANQEKAGRPSFGTSRMSPGGMAFSCFCAERDYRQHEADRKAREWQEKREADSRQRARDREDRMSKYR